MVKKFKEGNGLWLQPTWSTEDIKKDYFIQESLNNKTLDVFQIEITNQSSFKPWIKYHWC